MQLVAYGAQDIYLTGNPEITFFKAVYRRHTNFAMEQIQQSFNGTPASNQRASVIVSRNGDLVGDCVLEMDMSISNLELVSLNLGQYYNIEAAISTIELEIGGQQIDKHDCYWFRVFDELNRNESEKRAYLKLTSRNDSQQSSVGGPDVDHRTTLMLPLIFAFNRNPGLYLPLIALQYHEVKLIFEFSNATTGTEGFVDENTNVSLWCNYIYIDTEERRRFAQNKHEYLIDQLQIMDQAVTPTTTSQNIELNFNHPVKYLAWIFNNSLDKGFGVTRGNFTLHPNTKPRYGGGFTSTSDDIGWYSQFATVDSGGRAPNGQSAVNVISNNSVLSSAQIRLNGQDRMALRCNKYYSQYQPLEHFGTSTVNQVYAYSFALRPAEHQPSGTCNFSRIDNSQFVFMGDARHGVVANSTEIILKMYAVNYNVLRVQSGMGGLAYSN